LCAKLVGRELSISDATVKIHRKALMRKFHGRNLTHCVAIALRAGWIE
jgi:DNA-binding NarL/FixJ family response regulator